MCSEALEHDIASQVLVTERGVASQVLVTERGRNGGAVQMQLAGNAVCLPAGELGWQCRSRCCGQRWSFLNWLAGECSIRTMS
jgi:hypothetical protein